jgi:acyl carrier protein
LHLERREEAGDGGTITMKIFNGTEEALAWIAETFEENLENIQPDTPREKVEAWDSLGMLALMARFDEDLEIILDEDQAAELKTIGDVLEIMRAHGHLN